MATLTNKKTERQYYVDWLRILLILSVFLFHIGMIFNEWSWHVKNDVQYGGALKNTMIFLSYWRMPLLFLISGAGTYFAMGKRTSGQYLSERLKRLVIPLVVGIFTLVPVQVYIEKSADYSSLWNFYGHMFEGIYPTGNFSWHHLWFIAYLFVISLFIAPFLDFFRSQQFSKFSKWVERVVTKPLALNVFIIPLVLSQAILRPFFPETTHALIDDWASMSYYIIFFLAGFTLLSNSPITEAIRKHRFLYLFEAILVTIVMFKLPYMVGSESLGELIWDITSVFVAWSCGITAIGFAKQHLNKNNNVRKLANEAIYPFYLLHQPVIVVVGYFIVQWDVSVAWKVALISVSSFLLTVALYWIIVRPINVLRVAFGMKKHIKENDGISVGSSLETEPAIANRTSMNK